MLVRNHIAACAAVLGCLMAGPARADHRPVIAVPGNREVPVIIDGIDASYAVVSGNWGLYAPGAVVPEIYGPVVLVPVPGDRGYFPATGRQPRYGRQEINAPRRELPRAPRYFREWSAGSRAGTVTQYPQFDMPDVMVEPRSRENECTGAACRRSDRDWRRMRRARPAPR